MNKGSIEEFCESFNAYIAVRYGYKKDHARVSKTRDVVQTGTLKKFTFYLRFNPLSSMWPPDTLVISQIRFEDQRMGNGTDFILFIIEESQKFGIKNIGIECANHASSSLAAKCGLSPFKPHEGVHWFASVKDIRRFMVICARSGASRR